ncbi:alpha/beta hydrolase [Enterovibrio norvegicus FF-33]|uniref:Alpha/beta hydrolase n=1 Tax=Enterovibrio norvegicus FF-454 TaxID=1185651 RepID=A0A1E5C8G9_9GAMM|nr:alpha/beta hydrolase [Enterovibrio norvegicus]OEE61821.1 alpha/beta hydrolase [Enterovibrio norvegicus FF-454]OEE66618.1 alpha/beta hydrolase [Enterovibrio norvegicus FF-33]
MRLEDKQEKDKGLMKKRMLALICLIMCWSIYAATKTENEGSAPKQMSEDVRVPQKISGNPLSAHRVIFIHGSPGSKEAYDDYLNHPSLQQIELVSVDRLGFGQSSMPVETSLKKQAESLLPLLLDNKNTLLVGHSLGGPIALQLALLAPEHVDSLLLIASAFDPKLESPKWYNYIADTQLATWLVPDDMLRSNAEMMVLEHELEKLAAQDWASLTMPIVLVHGADDDLADPGNSYFAKQRLPNASLKMLNNEGHFVLWQNVPLLVNEIKAMIEIH